MTDDGAAKPGATNTGGSPVEENASDESTGDMELHDLRISVDEIRGRSVCGMEVGDYIDIVRSNEMRLPEGKHFCMYAFAAVLPMIAAKQRDLPENDWLTKDSHVACPDPEEALIMRIERTGKRCMRSEDLT